MIHIRSSSTYNNKLSGDYKDYLIRKISSLMADEFIACYQYRISALLSSRNYNENIINQFTEHSNDELKHFDMLCDLASKLKIEDKIMVSFESLVNRTNCKIDKIPFDTIENNQIQIDGESCAIKSYSELLKVAKENNDVVTCEVIKSIINDEVEHETDLEEFNS